MFHRHRRYPECRGAVFRPSYADDGSYDNLPSASPLLSEPPHRLHLERARGYHGSGFYPSTDNNAYFLGENHKPNRDAPLRPGNTGNNGTSSGVSGAGREGGEATGLGAAAAAGATAEAMSFEVVYPTAALVVMQTFRVRREQREEAEGEEEGEEGDGQAAGCGWTGSNDGENEQREVGVPRGGGGEGTGTTTTMTTTKQRFFDGHTDDVTAVAVHPGGVLVASGQVRCRRGRHT